MRQSRRSTSLSLRNPLCSLLAALGSLLAFAACADDPAEPSPSGRSASIQPAVEVPAAEQAAVDRAASLQADADAFYETEEPTQCNKAAELYDQVLDLLVESKDDVRERLERIHGKPLDHQKPVHSAAEQASSNRAVPEKSATERAANLQAEADALLESLEREQSEDVEELYDRVLDLLSEAEAEVHEKLARIHRKFTENHSQAVMHYEKAIAGYASLGLEERLPSVLNGSVGSYLELGDLKSVIRASKRALEICRRTGNRTSEAGALGNLAQAARYSGEIQEALGLYEESLQIYRELEQPRELGAAYNNRGRFHLFLGEDDRALADFEQARKIFEEIKDLRYLAVALTAIGQIHRRQGNPETARRVLDEALSLREMVGSERGLGVTLHGLASVFEDLGRPQAALAHFQRALSMFEEADAPRPRAETLVAIGRLSLSNGQFDETMSLLREALEDFRKLGDPAGEIKALVTIARLERAEGRLEAAAERMKDVLGLVENVRGSAAGHDIRAALLAANFDHFDLYIDLLMDLHAKRPDEGFDRQAFDISERSRSRSLLDLVAENRQDLRAGGDPELIAHENSLTQQIDQLARDRLDQLDRGKDGKVRTIEDRLGELVSELRHVRSEIRATSPRYAAITQPKPLSSTEVQQQVLDEDTLLLAYHLGKERSYLWAVTRKSVESYALPPRKEIERLARQTRNLLRESYQREKQQSAADATTALSKMVLAQVAARLESYHRVLVAPSGALHLVPFAALPRPETGIAAGMTGSADTATSRDELLVDSHQIVVLHSASALAMQRDLRKGRANPERLLVIFGDPVYQSTDPRLEAGPVAEPNDARSTWQRLEHAGREIDAIAKLAGPEWTIVNRGVGASREAVMALRSGDARYVHFATHGEIDDERPELSKLVLSLFDAQGERQEGFLHAYELFNLDLPVDLVALSACETGLGKAVRGEGLVGLTQGFIYAGAARVLVSLWPVDDDATAILMENFYRHLLNDQMTPAAALQAAQRDLRNLPRATPYHWAGFVLQGEWR